MPAMEMKTPLRFPRFSSGMLKLVRYAVAGFVGLCAWCAFLVLIEMYRGFSDACRPVDFTVFGFRVLELVGVRDVKVPASPFLCAIFTRYISSGALSAFSGEFLSQVAQTLVPSASAAACWLRATRRWSSGR